MIGVWTILKSEQAPTKGCEGVGAKGHEQPPRNLASRTRESVSAPRSEYTCEKRERESVDSNSERDVSEEEDTEGTHDG